MKKKKAGRPKKIGEVKEVCSFRLESSVKFLIVKKFGSIQKWLEGIIDEIKRDNRQAK